MRGPTNAIQGLSQETRPNKSKLPGARPMSPYACQTGFIIGVKAPVDLEV